MGKKPSFSDLGNEIREFYNDNIATRAEGDSATVEYDPVGNCSKLQSKPLAKVQFQKSSEPPRCIFIQQKPPPQKQPQKILATERVMHRPQKNLILIKKPSQHHLAIEPAPVNQIEVEIPAAIQGVDAVEAVVVDEVDVTTQPEAVREQSCGFVQYEMTDEQFQDYQRGLIDLEQFKSPVSSVKNKNNNEHQVEVVRVVEFVNVTNNSPPSLKSFDTGVVDNMNVSVYVYCT